MDKGFRKLHRAELSSADFMDMANDLVRLRLCSHADFVRECRSEDRGLKYRNVCGFPVKTRQEVAMTFERVKQISEDQDAGAYSVEYEPFTLDPELLVLFDQTGG